MSRVTNIATKQQALLTAFAPLGLTLYDTAINGVTSLPALVLEPAESLLVQSGCRPTPTGKHGFNIVVVAAVSNYDTLAAARNYVAGKILDAMQIDGAVAETIQYAETVLGETKVTLARVRIYA